MSSITSIKSSEKLFEAKKLPKRKQYFLAYSMFLWPNPFVAYIILFIQSAVEPR